ncbi:MAG: tetratricopeptide repeat protein [Candidatus Eiseniibacteriota bacterium]
MSCLGLEQLESYVSGTLDADSRGPVEAHLAACPSCRAVLDEVSQNLELAGDARSLRPTGSPAHSAVSMPERIGPFRILRELGRGGMGIVYLAEQDRPRRRVAIKVLRPGGAAPALLRRFEHEADLLGRLKHSGIAQIHGAGVTEIAEGGVAEQRPYLVMEYVEGERLDEWIVRRSPGTRQRLRLLAHLADAVHHAHVHGVVHRDLKPGNVVVQRGETVGEGAGGEDAVRPKILDFGVARATEPDLETASIRTEVGQLLGTVPFMSPEQVAGDSAQLDARSDVYSLGVLGWWLLAGELPYSLHGRSVPEAARIIRDEDARPLGSVDARLRGDVETILAKALEKDRERRYQSASELAADIRRYLADQPVVARPAGAAYQFRKFARRNRGVVLASAALLVVLIAAAVVSTTLAVQANRARELAERESAKLAAVNTFVTGMLSSPDPHRHGDREVTVVEVLDRAAAELEGGLEGTPDVEVALRMTLGNTYWALAGYDAAEEQMRAALEVQRTIPADAEGQAKVLGDLGLLLAETGRYEEAEAAFREQYERASAALGPGHAQTLTALSNLAGVLGDRDELAAAESVLVSGLEAARPLAGDDRDIYLSMLHTLGAIRYYRGDYPGAQAAFEANAAESRELFGEGHPTTIVALDALVNVLSMRGNHDRAAEVGRKVLAAQRSSFGDRHPQVAKALGSLANVLLRQADGSAAEPLLREALSIRRASGEDNRHTATTQSDLARAVDLLGRSDEAAVLYREALATQRAAVGEEHRDVAIILNRLAGLEARRRDFAAAESLYVRALAINRAQLGEEHVESVNGIQALAEIYDAWGKPEKAAAYRAALPADPSP